MSGRRPGSSQGRTHNVSFAAAGYPGFAETGKIEDPSALQAQLEESATMRSLWRFLKEKSPQLDFEADDKPTSEPADNDVICGRGGMANHHVGNKWYRELIRCNRDLYQNTKKRQKLMISKAIVAAIRNQNPPGRFLKLDDEKKLWFPIDYMRAVDKTSQSLREKSNEPSQGTDKTSKEIELRASLLSNVEGLLKQQEPEVPLPLPTGKVSTARKRKADRTETHDEDTNKRSRVDQKSRVEESTANTHNEFSSNRSRKSDPSVDLSFEPLTTTLTPPDGLTQLMEDTVAFFSGRNSPSTGAAQIKNKQVDAETRRKELIARQRQLQQDQIRQMEELRQRHIAQQQRLIRDAGLSPGMLPCHVMVPGFPRPQVHHLPPNQKKLMPYEAAGHRKISPGALTPTPVATTGLSPPVDHASGIRAQISAGAPSPFPKSGHAGSLIPVQPAFLQPRYVPVAYPPHTSFDRSPAGSTRFPPDVVEVPNTTVEDTATGSATSLGTDVDQAKDAPPLTRLSTQVSDWLQSFFPLSSTDAGANESGRMSDHGLVEEAIGNAGTGKEPPLSSAGQTDAATDGAEGIPPPLPLARSVSSALLALATSPSRFLSGLTALWDRTPSGGEPSGTESGGEIGDIAALPPSLELGTSLGSISLLPSLGEAEACVPAPSSLQDHVSWGTRMRDQDGRDALLDDVEESEEELRFRSLKSRKDC